MAVPPSIEERSRNVVDKRRLLELARFIRENRARFVAKMARLIVLGSVEVDGREIYTAKDLKVGLFENTENF